MRQKIADQVASASRNDAAPILGIFFECIPLEGIDLVADDAHDCHWQSFRLLYCGRVFSKGESGHRGDHAANSFAAIHVVGRRRRWPHIVVSMMVAEQEHFV